ncbi:MAG TPA: DinB family protein [Vicinamibacterales bacterium]
MTIAQSLLPEFDSETTITRTLLERVPENQPDWRPHEKSMSLGHLAMHIASLPNLAIATLANDEFDVSPPGATGSRTPAWTSRANALSMFDANVKAARETLAGIPDEAMLATWTLKRGGTTMFSIPRLAAFRNMVMNHLIHHRGQLSVYLRLNDVPLPSIYGPSADTKL